MKKSKLKYVFAFVFLAVVLAVSSNVQAVTFGSISLSNLATSRLSIVDGDEEGTITVDQYLTTENSTWSSTALGLNPVQKYTLTDKYQGITYQAYSTSPVTVTTQNAEFTYGSLANKNIGLAIMCGNKAYAGSEAARKAIQVYIWGQYGADISGAVNELYAAGDGSYSCYINIVNSVQQVQLAPSYTYSTVAEAKASPVELTWSDENQRYEATLEDINGLDTMAIANLIATPQGSSASSINISKNGNKITIFTTEQIGSVSNPVVVNVTKQVNYPYLAKTAYTDEASFVYLTGSTYDDEVYYLSIYTNAMKVKIQKQLNPSDTNSKTGDATVAGARYGLYSDSSCTKLVQELVTDSTGVAESKPLEIATYYVKELVASTGCKLDTNTYTVNSSEAVTQSNGLKVVTVDSKEDVIYGGFRMIVSLSNDLSGSTTKIPSEGSVIKLYLNSNENEYYTATVDSTGYVEFKNVAYGQYTCVEIERANVEDSETVDYMDPISININTEKEFIYSKIVNTEVAQRYVKIEKHDEETGKLVTGSSTTYIVTYVNSNGTETPVTQTVMYPVENILTEFVTADDDEIYGYCVLPEKLPYGSYRVYETTAPYGYYNESYVTGNPIATFDVDTNSTDDYDRTEMVVCSTQNIAQKGILTVVARGNVVSGTNVATTAYGQDNVMRPAYSYQLIPGAKYQVIANEDIVTGDGTVRMKQGEYIELTTDENGSATTKLYLGSYTLKMVSAPEGYVLDDSERTIEVEYQGQTVKEFNLDTQNYTLERQDYDLDVTKVFEGLNYYIKLEDGTMVSLGKYAYQDVLVGIYTAEDIINVRGENVIPKDTLVDVVTFDENGKGVFDSEYAIGKYYAKELVTNENYQLSTTKYEFEVKPTNNTSKRFDITIDDIVNIAKKETAFKVTKVEYLELVTEEEAEDAYTLLDVIVAAITGGTEQSLSEDATEVNALKLEDAEFTLLYKDADSYTQLYSKEGDEYVELTYTTDENGEFSIDGLPYGKYAVVETVAPRFYDLNENRYGFELTTDSKEVELIIEDDRTLVDVGYAVEDEDGNKLVGALVQLVDPETDEVVYEAETDEDGYAYFEQIRAGIYNRQVDGLDEWYVTPKVKEVTLEEDTELVETVKVKFVTGNILINKTDDETGEVVPECLFTVTNEAGEVVAEAKTDDNGQILITGLRYGVYYVEETEAAEDYEKSDLVYEVTITENGHTYVVDFTDVSTGDIAVVMYAIIALVSVSAIVVATKKLRRN